MPKFLPAFYALAAALVLGLGVWGCFGISKHVIVTVDKWGDAAPATVANEASITAAAAALTKTADAATATLGAAATTIAAAQPVLHRLDATVAVINHGCAPGPCGLLADTAKTLNTARGTMVQIEIAANHEDKNLGALDAQELVLFNDFHGLAGKGAETFTDINTLLESQAIHASLDSSAGILDDLHGITIDARKEVHQMAKPKTKRQIVIGYMPAAIKIGLIAGCVATGTACP
jgi:hypothetical protein